jgi:hypothetical protein
MNALEVRRNHFFGSETYHCYQNFLISQAIQNTIRSLYIHI